MSVFNGERYIARSVLSILTQTYTNFELILVDDGSTDHTRDIITRIHDNRIRFVRQENMGLTKSLNKGLALARGQWIARHDADDFSIQTRFAKQMAFLNNNPTVVLLGSCCFIQPEKHGVINEIYDYPEQHNDILTAFPLYNPFVHGSMMIKRTLFEEHGGYNETYRYVQDYELWARLLPETKAHNLTIPLYVRSVHREASQVSVNKDPIFNEIRNKYRKTILLFKKDTGAVRLIESIGLYPTITLANGWNKSIANSLYSISAKARQYNLPWFSMRLQSMMYCPWLFLKGLHI
jgi:glycosyltransferase involved in cell wall biosynthesis